MQIRQPARAPLFFAYFIFICVLFTLPGTAFPTDDWMSRIWFDKWVHIGIFFFLVMLFAWAFPGMRRKWTMIMISAAVYGLLVEWLQDEWIPNRSFDVGDWVADCVGVFAGFFIFRRYEKK